MPKINGLDVQSILFQAGAVEVSWLPEDTEDDSGILEIRTWAIPLVPELEVELNDLLDSVYQLIDQAGALRRRARAKS